ncbi:MAG TPA: hypothetical protein VME66_13945 [Candidatus Acidoferrales bacterium]|nr:hypothetical protein [Candidatus Acidoferrales bacterium]
MNRITLLMAVASVAFIATFAPLRLLAQDATPAPTPSDWMVYDDQAMHFHAPAGFVPVGQRQISLDNLKDDPTVVAGWIYPDKNHPRRLLIQQEFFDGDVNGFQAEYEGQMRNVFDSPLFKDKQHTSLRNGMPAIFEVMTTGSGFSVQKFYLLMWADGQRGVVVVLQTQIDDIDAPTARQLMSDATAVRYPSDQQ